MKAVSYFAEAEEEITAALLASRDAAEFRRAIDEALRDVANATVSHTRIARSPCRRCILTKYPYSVIYFEADDSVQVVAFPHHKRRTNYWKNRLPKP